MFVLGSLFAAQQNGAGEKGNFLHTLIIVTIALALFYLIFWRPEQKRRKKMEEQRAQMKKGDRVTAMGIIGTIDQVKEESVILNMVDRSKIEVVKAAITEVHHTESEKGINSTTPS